MLNQLSGSRADSFLALSNADLSAGGVEAAAVTDPAAAMSPSLVKAFGAVVGDAGAHPLWSAPAEKPKTWLAQPPGFLSSPGAWPAAVTGAAAATAGASAAAADAPDSSAAPAGGSPAAAQAPAASATPAAPAAPAAPASTYLMTYRDGTQVSLTDSQMDVIAVLQRHRKESNFDLADIQKKIDDPNTPSDLKAALKKIQSDKTLSQLLDTVHKAQQGKADSLEDGDGKIRDGDIDALGDLDAMKEFNAKRAKSYEANYIPSESKSAQSAGREITANDAAREFYLYSDNLPKDIDENTLHDIVNGELKGDKCPPQVMAAAQYYLDHPAAWKKLTADGNGRGKILDKIVGSVYLNPEENATIDTIDKNRDLFLGKSLKRDGLKDIINSNASAEVKQATQQLLDDPLLFGMLDNGMKGHTPKHTVKVDDGKICEKDFDGFLKRLTTRGKTPPAPPPGKVPTTPLAVAAVQDMNDGATDDPALKKPKGGNPFLRFLQKIGHIFAKIGTAILHVMSVALSFLGKIPILGPIFSGLSVAAEAGAGALHMVDTAITGGNMKQAAKMFGLGIAGAALGAILPGAGRLLMKGVEKIGETAAGRAVARGVQAVSAKVVTPAANAVKNGVAKVTAPIVSAGERVGAAARNLGAQAGAAAAKPIAAASGQMSAVFESAAARIGLGNSGKSAEEIAENAAAKAAARNASAARSAARKAAVARVYATATAPVRSAARAVVAARDNVTAGVDAAAERIGSAASSAGRTLAAPFVWVGNQAATAARTVGAGIQAAGARAGNGVAAVFNAGSEKVGDLSRRIAYRTGLRTPEGDAEKAAVNAVKKAEKAEAKSIADAEKAAAKKAKAEKKAAKKKEKEEKKKARRKAREEARLAAGRRRGSNISIDDIAIRMARMRQQQRMMDEDHLRSSSDDKTPVKPAAALQSAGKPLQVTDKSLQRADKPLQPTA